MIDEKSASPMRTADCVVDAFSVGLTDNTGERRIIPRDLTRFRHTGGGECVNTFSFGNRVAENYDAILPLIHLQMDTTGRLSKHGRSRLEHGSDTHRMQVTFYVQPALTCAEDFLAFRICSLVFDSTGTG